MNSIEEIYHEAKADEWFKKFAVFCRIALAASFIPTGLVKIMGERFAAGLPSNNPLGHYFDALHQTGYYYTFIGIAQIINCSIITDPENFPSWRTDVFSHHCQYLCVDLCYPF